jgi:hypothetical protein
MEVGLHPEGPATGQLDQGFTWFSSVLQHMVQLVPKFHVALYASCAAFPKETSKFSP